MTTAAGNRPAVDPSTLRRALKALAIQDLVQFAYLFALLFAVATGGGPSRPPALRYLLLDLALYCSGVLAYRSSPAPTRLMGLAYRFILCIPVLATFAQLHLILASGTSASLDAQLLALNQQLLHYEPAVAWDALVSPPLTEWLSLFYVSYFALLGFHILPLVFFEQRRKVLAEFSLGIITLYCVGHTLYLVVPAYGPYVHLAGTFKHTLQGPYWYPLMRHIVAAGGARADVFPSLHTAGPSFMALFSFRHRHLLPFRYTWPLVAFISSQIIIATMYLRWHYLIDIIAGLTVTASVSLFAKKASEWETAARARKGQPAVWV